jgi:hypothetical protein
MTVLRQLFDEYIALKNELFGDAKFVVADLSNPENKAKWLRYQTLLETFHPQFKRRQK